MKNCRPSLAVAITALSGVCLALGPLGCHPTPPVTQYYNGPTDPMWKVAADINQNSGKIPSLWALLEFKATLVDDSHHRSTSLSGDGTLLFSRPQSLLLRGTKDLVGEVFALGSNDSEFWLKLGGDVDTTWWGHYANLGKPGCESMPISPDMVLQVLGISFFDSNFLAAPMPVMKFDNDQDAYEFTWIVRGVDRLIAVKEIWYDRATLLPRLVRLFDENGRIVLAARLSGDVSLDVPDLPKAQWPRIASRYDLQFPDDGSSISFWFSDNYALRRHGHPRSTDFNRPEPDTKQVNQIDKNCGPDSGAHP